MAEQHENEFLYTLSFPHQGLLKNAKKIYSELILNNSDAVKLAVRNLLGALQQSQTRLIGVQKDKKSQKPLPFVFLETIKKKVLFECGSNVY